MSYLRRAIRVAVAATWGMASAACGQAPASRADAPSGDRERADLITEALIRRHVGVIADDSMLGRNTPSRGLELTAAYIASEFRRLGLQPGGDSGSFLQRYPLADDAASRSGSTAALVRVVRSGGSPSAEAAAPDGPGFDPHSAPNVVGILRGTDPVLRDEYVVVSAHMDHVGVNGAVAGDSIWNGADDDASGTTGVLAVAEALAGAAPRRSVIFLTVSGEEKGLWGSRWFTSNPPVPIERLVANINLDMIGRNWKDSIVVIGTEHSDLGQTLLRVNARHPELGLQTIADLWPQENFFFRSDHYNFARRGVPALFFFNGTHADYHQPGDSPDKIDAEKESRIVRLVYHLVREVASAPDRPAWNPESRRRIVDRP